MSKMVKFDELPEEVKHRYEFLLSERIILERYIEKRNISKIIEKLSEVEQSKENDRIINYCLLHKEIIKLSNSDVFRSFHKIQSIRIDLIINKEKIKLNE